MDEILRSVEAELNPDLPKLRSGDQVSVHLRISEGGRERVQEFRGTVIRVRNKGNNRNFTVRRVASGGVGVERTFLMRSPLIDKIELERHSEVRRAKLYFLRDRTGKRARLKQRFDN
jgi:large subunit ribosomal protein L19